MPGLEKCEVKNVFPRLDSCLTKRSEVRQSISRNNSSCHVEKFCQAEKNQRKKFVFPDRREGKQLFYTERSEVKTVFLTEERVKHFFRGFFSGQAKIFSCDRILFFGKVASDQTIRSLASNWSLMDAP